jgi:hypothetical protein
MLIVNHRTFGVTRFMDNVRHPEFEISGKLSYLEFRTMDKVHKPSDSECYTPSSEPFRFYFYDFWFSVLCGFPLVDCAEYIRCYRALNTALVNCQKFLNAP